MGVDLTLLPLLSERVRPDTNLAHTQLHCERRRELFEAIATLETTPLPSMGYFGTFLCRNDACEDSHYGDTREDGYGAPLGWLTAYELLQFTTHPGVEDNPTNVAVWAYLWNLPDDWPIVLYWH